MTTDHIPAGARPEPHPLLTYKKAAARLGMPVGTLYALVSEGRIPHIRISKRMVRFDPVELDAWVDARRVAPRDRVPWRRDD